MTPEFAAQSAVVVGGSSGIGQASAELFAERGAQVAVVGPDVASAKQVADQIVARGGVAIALAADVRDEDRIASVFEDVTREFGGLDVLVCTAGIQRYGSVTATATETWNDVFDVNVKGAFFVSRAALPALRESGHGSVVIVSSVQAFATQRDVAAYTSSKGALNALVRSMAVDEADYGVRVNGVCPGSVDTPMLRASARLFSSTQPGDDERLVAEWGRAHPLGRVARSREVAEVVTFLASDRASFVSGQSISVDGGLIAKLAVELPKA